MGVTLVRGNHEQHTLDAMTLCDEEVRQLVSTNFWPRVHKDVLSSYGLYPNTPSPLNALYLRDRMHQIGHLAYLLSTVPYVEGDDFVCTHAEVSEEGWENQKNKLDNFVANAPFRSIENLEMPIHFGEGLKIPSEGNLLLAGIGKTLLNGHYHLSTKSEADRIIEHNQRILLGTSLKSDFVTVYETWNKRIRFLEIN
jgi:hypothetical protein